MVTKCRDVLSEDAQLYLPAFAHRVQKTVLGAADSWRSRVAARRATATDTTRRPSVRAPEGVRTPPRRRPPRRCSSDATVERAAGERATRADTLLVMSLVSAGARPRTQGCHARRDHAIRLVARRRRPSPMPLTALLPSRHAREHQARGTTCVDLRFIGVREDALVSHLGSQPSDGGAARAALTSAPARPLGVNRRRAGRRELR